MKTVFITLVSGLSIILLTSAGIRNNDESLNDSSLNLDVNIENMDYAIEDYVFDEFEGDLVDGEIIRVRDVKVKKIEEEVKLGFDTEDYLPENFNPYEGLDIDDELNFEEKLMFTAVFGDVTKEEIVEIENIILYEIDDMM